MAPIVDFIIIAYDKFNLVNNYRVLGYLVRIFDRYSFQIIFRQFTKTFKV